MANIYFGRDQHAIDSKGRVNIPARHRRIAAESGCHEFWLSPGFGDFVMLWDARGFEAYSERLMALPLGDEKVQDLIRSIYSNSAKVEPDGQGRVVIPDHLRKAAGLTTQVQILGVKDHLQLWDPETYETFEDGKTLAEKAREVF